MLPHADWGQFPPFTLELTTIIEIIPVIPCTFRNQACYMVYFGLSADIGRDEYDEYEDSLHNLSYFSR